jgi:FAD/FMN-containing dehydrogenase
MIAESQLKAIVGSANVIDDEATLKSYSGDISFVHPVRPGQVVYPRNTGDIEQLVKLARESRTPLVAVSSGPPHFRGDTIPGAGGSVIVDLSHMKRIIRVDRQNRSAMFEPGVTFAELIQAVGEKGLRLNLPLLPRNSKSVVGSLLEREPAIMPKYHWDISDPASCFEVVFGTGDVFRTGAAAGPGTLEEQWEAGGAQKEAAGPSASSWYRLIQGAQGTMGIVSWATARCEISPSREEPYLVGSSDLEKILELVHWLIRLRLVNECLVLNGFNLAAVMANKEYGGFHNLSRMLPQWVLFFNIAAFEYLPELRIKGQVQDMLGLAQREGLEPKQDIGGVSAFAVLEAVQRPSSDLYWKLRYKGASQDIFFITTYDKISPLVAAMYQEAEKAGYPTSDIGIYLQPVVQGVNCHCEFNLFYDAQVPDEAEKVKQLSSSAVLRLMSKGAFFSRPYGENARMIMNRDAATVAALHKVKSILDPDNILNPGKLCF